MPSPDALPELKPGRGRTVIRNYLTAHGLCSWRNDLALWRGR